MLGISDEPTLHWVAAGATLVLVTLIRCVASYFRDQQRLNAFKFFLLVMAQSPKFNPVYLDDWCEIRAHPPASEDDDANIAVLPVRPAGQPERRRNGRRRSDAP
jgi:hypothetical protein